MKKDNIVRYSRLIQLSSFSLRKLSILGEKKVLLIGVGGVGQYVATSLITNGIKYLTIVDFDKVELSNLNRQILLKEEDVGKLKTDVVLAELIKKNSEIEICARNMKVTAENAESMVEKIDLIIDAVDNWPTKLVLGDVAKKHNIPLLHIGVDGNRGQYCLFKEKSLSDVFDNSIKKEPRDGVMGPMVGTVASLASMYLINYLVGDAPSDILYYFDAKENKLGQMKI